MKSLKLVRASIPAMVEIKENMAMPHISGDRLASEVLKIRPDIPILLCTGPSERIDEDKAREMGIMGFAMKPL